MIKHKKVYLNPKQQRFLAAPQSTRCWIGGRGSGKSVGIGASQRQKMTDLPRAKFFFCSSTYNQILTKTLPAITKIWENFGIKEYIPGVQKGCYVKWKRPPRDWYRPYSAPEKYTNVITFWNGYTIELLSMDRPEIARGGSYDGGEIDEAAVIKHDVYSQVLIPSIRDNDHKFTHWSHHQLSLYSSMPWKAEGMWLLDFEEKAKLYPEDYFYLESVSADNLAVLGEKTLKRWKDEMTHATYQIEILNKRHGKSDHCFYHAFDDEKHTYKPRFLYLEDDSGGGIYARGLQDMHSDKMIELSCDFGGWFSGFTCYQDIENTEYLRDAFYVKENQGLDALVKSFCHKYKDHKYKVLRIWGEPFGHNKQPNGFTYYQQLENAFKSEGWNVEIAVSTAASDVHENRYEFVNKILSEDDPFLPKLRINEDTGKDVIISIQNTEVTPDFKKDKKNERNRSFNQAHATHYTDMIDYYLMQKHGWKVHLYGINVMGNSATVA